MIKKLTRQEFEWLIRGMQWVIMSGDNGYYASDATGTSHLRTELILMGYNTIVEITGNYEGQTEPSLLVAMLPAEQAQRLAERYGQDSYIIRTLGEGVQLIKTQTKELLGQAWPIRNVEYNTQASDNFSIAHLSDGDLPFTITFE